MYICNFEKVWVDVCAHVFVEHLSMHEIFHKESVIHYSLLIFCDGG